MINQYQHQHGMGRVKHIHFVGIGGAGMSGIAEVLCNLGYKISGSDIKENRITRNLQQNNIEIFIGHDARNVQDCDVIVKSTAIKDDNIELQTAIEMNTPIVRRAEMLAELMRFSQGIAVAGTHGKTTTTSLIVSLLIEGNLDPTYVIGGMLSSSDSNSKLGKGKYFVAEADESDASFLHLSPVMAVLTNIDADHLDTYQGDLHLMQQHFLDFLHQLPFYGLVCICLDDVGNKNILSDISRPLITYALHAPADYMANILSEDKAITRFSVTSGNHPDWQVEIEMSLPGEHNISNALAAIAVAHELGVSDEAIIRGLHKFQGIHRRFQLRGDINIAGRKMLLIDDYAHHPTEIQAVLQTIRSGWKQEQKLVVVYQPHRYTRTRDLFEDFSQVLSEVDALIMLDVYAAGEAPVLGADSRSLCRAIRLRGKVEPVLINTLEELEMLLPTVMEDSGVLLTLGAGDISVMSRQLYEKHAC